MTITMQLYYTGSNGSAQLFVKEMEETGIATKIRQEPGNLAYDYYQSLSDPETILLVDSWKDQEALDIPRLSHDAGHSSSQGKIWPDCPS